MFQVYHFTTASGRQPVNEFINKQSQKAGAKIDDKAVIMLHAIIKKTNKTPSKEIRTAEKRLQQVGSILG